MGEPIRVLYWGMTENIGGIESFIINVYRNIDRSKVQIDFLLNRDMPKIAFEEEIKELGGHIYRVMIPERKSWIGARKSLDNFFKTHSYYKAVHIHANFPYAFPLKYAKKYGIPLRIIHSHNSSHDKKSKGIKNILSTLRDVQIKSQIKKYPNCYLACSDLAANYMFPNQDYTWIKNGINLEKFRFNEESRNEIRKELYIEEDCTLIGFIGRLREQKNLFFLIDIFQEYLKLNSNSKLFIAGIGEQEKELKEYAHDLIENKDIIFLGKREDADKLYQAMDVFLLPSLYEGLPVVLVESQTAGLPSFTSDVVTKQVDLTDLINYYPLDKSAQDWAKAIKKYLNNKDRNSYYDIMESQGFDVKNVALELEKLYLK